VFVQAATAGGAPGGYNERPAGACGGQAGPAGAPHRDWERIMKPTFFRTPSAFRAWLEAHHANVGELWVGYYKKDSGKPSVTWPESVDEALCYGWIDGIRKRVDDISYVIRFTPRRRGSIWSRVNVARAHALVGQGRMQPPGLAAFDARTAHASGIYSYERRPAELPQPYAGLLKKNRAAFDFLRAQPPSYRRIAAWWVVSAKREDTRLKRLERLTAGSARGLRLPELTLKTPAERSAAPPQPAGKGRGASTSGKMP
jgi:uncharacterized protein YdeI (YjbR/CyaY-like superfamily)